MKKNNRLGVASVSFKQQSPREILEAMKAAGLNAIEWSSDVHAPCFDTDTLKQLAELQKEYGIECSSYGTYFKIGKSQTEELCDYIAAAKILGTNVLRVWCGSKSGEDFSDAEREEFIRECKACAKIAENAGAVLCMECHKKTFTQRLDDALMLMREVNSPSFLMYWQPFQWQSVEENLVYAEAIAPYTRHIHTFQLKDRERFSLADGIEEWKAYVSKFTPPHTLLLEFIPGEGMTELEKEASALRKIVGEE